MEVRNKTSDGTLFRTQPKTLLVRQALEAGGLIWNRLPPLVRDKLLGQFGYSYAEPLARVITPLHADVRYTQKQRMLICGDEAALLEEPLEVEEEPHLLLGRGSHIGVVVIYSRSREARRPARPHRKAIMSEHRLQRILVDFSDYKHALLRSLSLR